MKPIDILLYGTGSLATAIVYSLSLMAKMPVTVMILSRNLQQAQQLAMIANIRSISHNNQIRFYAETIHWNDTASIQAQLKRLQPKIILHTASLQSPLEIKNTTSAWGYLVKHLGYGITLPLQAQLVLKVARALKKLNLNSLLINACYPDGVNPLLKNLELPIFCGVGNIGILQAYLAKHLFKKANDELKILAHHCHFDNNIKSNKIQAWLNNNKILLHPRLIKNFQTLEHDELNQITGVITAKTCLNLLANQTFETHLPGPNGLPGGYPVRINDQEITINLPEQISLENTIIWNQECALLDGIKVEKNTMAFKPEAAAILQQLDFPYAEGFANKNIDQVYKQLFLLRERLREIAYSDFNFSLAAQR